MPEVLQDTRELIKKNELWSDMYKNLSKSPVPGSEKGYAAVGIVQMPPNPVEQAALHYMRDHAARALNDAIEGLLKDLFVG